MSLPSVRRDRPVRNIKPPSQPVSDLELSLQFGDSSDDSDFHIEDINEGSDDSFNSDEDEDRSSGDEENDLSDDEESNSTDGLKKKSVQELIEQAALQTSQVDLESCPVCCVCLGTRSDHDNEIVECDRCGVSVHECCYGVSDAISVSSTDSLCPTEPWFCEPCKEGVYEPNCELCPNAGGIFKCTDVGRWVHLVCALYVPAIAFGEVDRLANVTLFEMPYNKWGWKPCGLCQDERLARTGVQIACDAGMCKQFFHVTCGQREGLLSEAWSDDVDQADPFYAHCKLHTDKTVMHRRRTNFIILSVRQAQRKKELQQLLDSPTPEALRIQRKLNKKQLKYKMIRKNAIPPWVPTQKMPRLLTTSASACRALWRKAALMDVDELACESKEARAKVLKEISNKWHIQPAFSVEFTAYFLDRNSRIPTLKNKLQDLLDKNAQLIQDNEALKLKYSSVVANKEECEKVNAGLKSVIEAYHKVMKLVQPDKRLPIVQDLILHARANASHTSPLMVPTAAALKAGVGYPILRTNYKGHQQTEPRIHIKQEQQPAVSSHSCGICHGTNDQHLLTRCDACNLYYHLGCLSPPLTRMPKKTKSQGWECSECDKETVPIETPVSGPRKARHKSPPSLPDAFYPKLERLDSQYKRHGKKKKRKAEQAAAVVSRDGPEVMPPIRIKIKAVPSSDGLAAGTFVASSSGDVTSSPISSPTRTPSSRPIRPTTKAAMKEPMVLIEELKPEDISPPRPKRASGTSAASRQPPSLCCHTCHKEEEEERLLVRCDECHKCYHFGCLDPPLKKTPKVRGYSWHCAQCDPSDNEKVK